MKDPKHFAKAKLMKRAPKGVDPKKHERCVQDVKEQGHDVGSAHAICTASMKKAEDVSTRDEKSRALARKVIAHNRKKLNKSVDFKDTLVSIDSKDQMLAEKTASPAIMDYIKSNLGVLKSGPGASVKIPFPTGMLTMSEREAGCYHGHFQDMDGQIVEKFDSQTVALIAKTLQIKSLVPDPVEAAQPASPPVPASEQQVQMLAAAHDRIDMTHNRIDALQRQVMDQVRGKSIRIKYGDFELEIKKSLQDFIGDFKAGRELPGKDVVRKAITSWRKKNSNYLPLQNDQQAARELMDNWNQHQDGFCQFVDAISRGDDEQD